MDIHYYYLRACQRNRLRCSSPEYQDTDKPNPVPTPGGLVVKKDWPLFPRTDGRYPFSSAEGYLGSEASSSLKPPQWFPAPASIRRNRHWADCFQATPSPFDPGNFAMGTSPLRAEHFIRMFPCPRNSQGDRRGTCGHWLRQGLQWVKTTSAIPFVPSASGCIGGTTVTACDRRRGCG